MARQIQYRGYRIQYTVLTLKQWIQYAGLREPGAGAGAERRVPAVLLLRPRKQRDLPGQDQVQLINSVNIVKFWLGEL